MCGDSSEESTRRFALEQSFGQPNRWTQGRKSKSRESYRVLRPMQHGSQELVSQLVPITRQRLHQAPIRPRIAAKLFRCKIEIAIQAGRSPIIERMCQRNVRLNPFETESLKWQRFEVGRTCGEGVDCRTNIVHEVRQRQFRRTCAAANCCVRFTNKNGASGARKRDCGGKTIRSRSDNYRVIRNPHETSKT